MYNPGQPWLPQRSHTRQSRDAESTFFATATATVTVADPRRAGRAPTVYIVHGEALVVEAQPLREAAQQRRVQPADESLHAFRGRPPVGTCFTARFDFLVGFRYLVRWSLNASALAINHVHLGLLAENKGPWSFVLCIHGNRGPGVASARGGSKRRGRQRRRVRYRLERTPLCFSSTDRMNWRTCGFAPCGDSE